ncbi:MAG: hypothetical protein ACYCY3_05155 [Halothiobacillus sp.]
MCLDAQGRQITANASAQGLLDEYFGRDRSDRGYFREAVGLLHILEGSRMSAEQMQV